MTRLLLLLPLLAPAACEAPETSPAPAAPTTSAEVIGSGAGASAPAGAAGPASTERVSPGAQASPPGSPPLAPPPAVQGRPTNGPPPPAPLFEYPMRLVGTEPFWGGRIARDGITISGADRPDMRFPFKDPAVTGAGARFRSQSIGAFPVDITLVRELCSDGMSDKRYPFEATVVLGKETLKGCAIREAEFGGER